MDNMFGQFERDGWFFTQTFNVYQRVNQDVYVYISKQFGFYTLQLYQRGTTNFCTLEARSETNLEALFKLGETWLHDFEHYEETKILSCPYYIGNPELHNVFWIE